MLDLLLGNMPLALLVAGLVLMGLEAISPGAHLIVIGVALVGAGLIGVLVPLTLSPIVLAALTLVIGLGAAYVYREFDFYGGKGTARTTDSSSLAGATGYVTETVTARDGEVKLDEGGFAPYYSARSTSGTIEEGEEIIVLDPGGGNVVTVESLGAIGEDEIDRALERDRAATETETDTDGGDDLEPTPDADGVAESASETETERSS
ncbi:NfeD family protein [Haloterrigena alkaliphila]|uniref:NfeD family protein n=1 Tax=Haloterrigena alkaliphila TaxID=2816475 RepID=A0A8A2VA86_9EURY|nr:NfeD family protein [Haloterrigena alkaliphila]QSW97976.1 NfeD family protein [Haloterrigena alkaliphila]